MLRALSAFALSVLAVAPVAAETVNIYSYRQADLVAPLLDAFTASTGIKTQVLFLDKGLVERVAAEGANSPVDVILTTNVGRLIAAQEAGLLQPVDSDNLRSQVPAALRDPDNNWFALTERGRIIYAARDRVSEDDLTYEDLADPRFKGRLCMRSGQHDYNLDLFASLVAHHGAEEAERLIAGYKANLARKPQGNDRAQAKAIYAGECDLALGNSYYVGLMMTNETEPEQKDWAAALKLIFPNRNDRGTHVNISGMALARYTPHPQAARALMEFLASDVAQALYAERVFEYPVSPSAKPSAIVAGFGELRPDALPLGELARNRKVASEIVDRVGFDN